jgi:REP element-mobilizing transposase RayT
MARKPRIHIPGGVYHVMLRGNAGQAIFFNDEDQEHFESLIAEGIGRYGHRIHGYCWMINHIHLALQVGEVPLSRIIQNLAFRYTRWINKRQGRIGHLFQGRYKAILVDADAYLLELIRYIHLNPVRAGLGADPAAHRWSGHRTYLGLERTLWLTTDWVYAQFAGTLSVARNRYARFVAEGLGEGRRVEFHQGTTQGRLLGDDEFIAKALRAADQESLGDITLDTIITVVCQACGVEAAALAAADRTRAGVEARALVAWLAMETGATTLTEVGARFNRDVATLSNAVRRLRPRLAKEAGLAARTQHMKRQLSQ